MEEVLSQGEVLAIAKRERKAKKRLADQTATLEGARKAKVLIMERTAKALARR